jgi:NDP-sugar pyrophosphorylase family protein
MCSFPIVNWTAIESMKAMVFAAGRGTRLAPLTDSHPKCLVEAGGKPLLQHCLEWLHSHGVSAVVVNTHHHADEVREWIKAFQLTGMELSISHEPKLLETGGGLLAARDHFQSEEHFLAVNSDVFTDLNLTALWDHHTSCNNLATLAVASRTSTRYLRFDEHQLLTGWENQKTGDSVHWGSEEDSRLAFNGIQVFSRNYFEHLEKHQGAFSNIPIFLEAARSGGRIEAYAMDSAAWFDVGTIEKLESLRRYLAG